MIYVVKGLLRCEVYRVSEIVQVNGSKSTAVNGHANKPAVSQYPLVNIQKTMGNHHFQWENPLINGHFQ